jgi:hypothetical protein
MTYEERVELFQDLEKIQKAHDEQKRLKEWLFMAFDNALWSFENFWDIYGTACTDIRRFSRKYVPKGTEVEEARAKLVASLHLMIKDLEGEIELNWQTKEEPKTDPIL